MTAQFGADYARYRNEVPASSPCLAALADDVSVAVLNCAQHRYRKPPASAV